MGTFHNQAGIGVRSDRATKPWTKRWGGLRGARRERKERTVLALKY